MYGRFADSTRKAMQLANQEAQRLHHEYIGTEHVLLALTKLDDEVVRDAIVLGVRGKRGSAEAIQARVESFIQNGPDLVTMGKLPHTPRAKKVVEYAIEEASGGEILPFHLLLGCLEEREGVAALVLKEFGYESGHLRTMYELCWKKQPKASPAAESCKTCRFFLARIPRTPDDFGHCRRRAPVSSSGLSVWPAILGDHWCGEYEKQTN